MAANQAFAPAGRRIGLLLALLLLLAACGDDEADDAGAEDDDPAEEDADAGVDDDTDDETGDDGADGEPEVTELNVGVLPLAHLAPLYIALEEGFFEDEGLDVTPEVFGGGAEVVPAMQAGEVHFGYGNYNSWFLATSEGIETRVIAENDRGGTDHQILALEGSGIDSVEDLEGATVANNTLNNTTHTAMKALFEDAGISGEVDITEVPFPEMAATVDRGDLEAAWFVEPFVTAAKAELDVVTVVEPFTEEAVEGLPVAGYGTLAEFAEENPETVAGFRRALEEATALAADDEDRVREIIPTYTEIEEEVAEEIVLPIFPEEGETEELQRVLDLMVEYDDLGEPLEIEEVVDFGDG